MRECKVLSERPYFMCPNMFFGIMIKVKRLFEADRMHQSLQVLGEAHPLIKSKMIMEEDSDEVFYDVKEEDECSFQLETKGNWQEIFKRQSETGWDIRDEKLLKVSIFEEKETFQVLFMAHHLLCDEYGLLTLVQEFADFYVLEKQPQTVEEMHIGSMEDFVKNLKLPFMIKRQISSVNKQWEKSDYRIGYDEYLMFEREYGMTNPIHRRVLNFSEGYLSKVMAVADAGDILVSDIFAARIMKKKDTRHVMITENIRGELKESQKRVVGNYAVSYEVSVKKTDLDTVSLAKKIRSSVKKIQAHPAKKMQSFLFHMYLRPELIDSIAISAFGSFPSEAGKTAGEALLEYKSKKKYGITDLGKITSESIEEAVFIPSASPANQATWGILTVNDKMKVVESALRLDDEI